MSPCKQKGQLRRVDYAAIDVEEFGSVYESLLDFHPQVRANARKVTKFLVDAQLPKRLAAWLNLAGYDAIHTRDLPRQNRTADVEINAISIQEQRIVITKDSDFLDSFLLNREPYKLLQVTTGNITNSELEALLAEHVSQIVSLFEQHDVIELSRGAIIVHQ